jgi:hydrogenase-4 component B
VLASAAVLIAASCLIGVAVSFNSVTVEWQTSRLFSIGFFPITFHLDTLSSVFLGLLGVVSVPIAFFSPGYLNHLSGRIHFGQYWAAFFLFVLSMALVVMSGDAVTFIVFWELMSLSSVALVAAEHTQHKVRRAALIYLGATRIATAFLASGFIWMYFLTHSWKFTDWHFDVSTHYPAAFLILIGFCIKAGIWPFHIWLPYAHPAAPTPVSALMSGVMIKIALYGIMRILILGDLNCLPLAYLTLVLGTVSAFWGVIFALVQHDLKKLLAYSSVENVGLILMGIAIALLSKSAGLFEIAALGLAASLFHCVNHGIFKVLLFLGTGSVDVSAHTRNMAQLGGLGRKMPWTMACFLIGSAAICSLPPVNGFASKWLIYRSLFQSVWQTHSLLDRGVSLVIICILGVVGGLALACFSKAVAVVFLGNPRSKLVGDVCEGSFGMIAAQVFLATSCLALGLVVPQVLTVMKPICDLALHQSTSIQSAFEIPQVGIAITLFTLILITYTIFLSRSRKRQYITWECGFGKLSSRCQVAPGSFAQPIAWIFSPILRYKLATEITGKDRRHFPEQITVAPLVVANIETDIYAPPLALVDGLARSLAKMQAGSIHLYLIYLCVTLILLLLLGTRL